MAIYVTVGVSDYEIGSGSFFNSFFSTISYHLEPNGWGSKYPVLMNEFYQGTLEWKKAEEILKNILEIREYLKKYTPDKVIWDIKDLKKRPPWGDNISTDITDLSNYFVTSDGNDLFDVLINAFAEAVSEKEDLSIN
jgi:hypothetical protein